MLYNPDKSIVEAPKTLHIYTCLYSRLMFYRGLIGEKTLCNKEDKILINGWMGIKDGERQWIRGGYSLADLCYQCFIVPLN